MKKSIVSAVMFLMVSSNSFAIQQSLNCNALGATFGIKKISVQSDNFSQSLLVDVSVANNQGRLTDLSAYKTAGSLAGNFQIGPHFMDGPFGISDVFLVNDGGKWALETKTFCNFYYQEETCGDGDLIGDSFDRNVSCELN